MASIGERILERRKQLNLTQKELADKVGITEVSLSRYENDLREPKADIIIRLSKALDMTSDNLLGIAALDLTNKQHYKEKEDIFADLSEEGKKQLMNYIDLLKLKYKKTLEK